MNLRELSYGVANSVVKSAFGHFAPVHMNNRNFRKKAAVAAANIS